jgi:hypothetical protein
MIDVKIISLIFAMSFIALSCNKQMLNDDGAYFSEHWDYVDYQLKSATPESVEVASFKKEYIETVFLDYYSFRRTDILQGDRIHGYPVAGIVNHHALAMDIQARFFKSLKQTNPNIGLFIIISPDHFTAGEAISTHEFSYLTYHGTVKTIALPNNNIYKAKSKIVFENEHGVGSLIPFLAREFPNAEIMPVYIRPEATKKQLDDLANTLKDLMDENVFILISSDMSHYLNDAEARKNDLKTIEWLATNNWIKLSSVNDDFTDSAKSFLVVSGLFDKMKINPNFVLLDYAVSTDYGGDPQDTTSYITGFYVK